MSKTRLYTISRRCASELLIICSIPVILAVLYHLSPNSFQQKLVLDHTSPDWYAFWTHSFVHEPRPNASHLNGNIFAYSILIVPCWYLYMIREQKRMFWTGILIILSITPIVASGSSYLIFHEMVGAQIKFDRGFSGIVGAIDGFLIMSILQTFKQEQEESVAILSISLYASYLVIGIGSVTGRLPLLGLGLLGFGATVVGVRTRFVASADQLAKWGEKNQYLSIVLVTAALVSALAFANLLPAEVTNASGGITNIVAHGAGILFGMGVEVGLRNSNILPLRLRAQTIDR